MQLRDSVSSTNLQLSPHLTPRRPVTPGSPSTATTRSKAQTTRAQFRAFPGSVRAQRQEIRGVGDVRQVAGTRGVTTTFSSHGRTRAWVPREARTGTSPAGARSSLEPRSLVPVPGAHPRAGDAASPLPPAVGERRSRLGASEGEGWVKRPREPRSWVSGPRHPGAQLRLPARRALRLPHCALAFRERLPSPGSSFTFPFPPKYEQVQLRPARKLAAAAGSCGQRAARSRSARGARENGLRRPAQPRAGSPGTNARGPTRALRFTWQASDSPGTFGPDSSGADVRLTSLPSPAGSRVPLGPFVPALGAAPAPPPPYPLRQKCHSFSAFGSFSKSPRGRQELSCDARRASPADALPRPAAVPCAPPGRGEEPLVAVTVPRARRAVRSPSLAPSLARVAAACLCRGSSFPCS